MKEGGEEMKGNETKADKRTGWRKKKNRIKPRGGGEHRRGQGEKENERRKGKRKERRGTLRL